MPVISQMALQTDAVCCVGVDPRKPRSSLRAHIVKHFHYDDHEQLPQYLANFIDAYNFDRRLKTLKGLTPYEFICKQWTSEPKRFRIDPIHQMRGLNS